MSEALPTLLQSDIGLLIVAGVGALAGSALALLPGLHIYNVAGGLFWLLLHHPRLVPEQVAIWFLLGALVGWVVVNVVPSVFLFAPDDANAVVILPTTRWFMRGRGFEAALLVGSGSLGALVGLVLIAPWLAQGVLPVWQIVQPHVGWMLVAVLAFLLLGEWPRADERAPSPLRRLASAWAYLGAGLLTFVLSSALGIVLFYRSPLPVTVAFQNLMPAFVGLFAVPGLVQLLLLSKPLPPQRSDRLEVLSPRLLLRGTATGLAGGLFSSVLPVVTGSIGGLLAGHATAVRDERVFMVSLGASKVGYYVGSLLLLFVPGVGLVRGGMAGMINALGVAQTWRAYALAVAGVAAAGAVAFGMLVVFARAFAQWSARLPAKGIAGLSLVLVAALTVGFAGMAGLGIMLVGTSIGLIPVLLGGRRLNALGVILTPITLNTLGLGPSVAAWLGLL